MKGKRFEMVLSIELLRALDEWRSRQRAPLKRGEAARRLLDERLRQLEQAERQERED